MAPLTLRVAKEAYDKAVTDLKWSCHTLERVLPPSAEGDQASFPPSKPRLRLDSVAACPQCAIELEALDAGERTGHQCTHGERRGSDSHSIGETEDRSRRGPARGTVRQPKHRVVVEYLGYLTDSLKAYVAAVGNVCCVLTREEDKQDYEDLMLLWVDYCEDVKDRARDTIDVLEAAQLGTTQVLPAPQTDAATSGNTTPATITSDDLTADVPGLFRSHADVSVSQGLSTETVDTQAPASQPNTSTVSGNPTLMTVVSAVTRPPIMAATVASGHDSTSRAASTLSGFVVGTGGISSGTNVEVTTRHMNSIGNEINEELTIAEQEVTDASRFITEGGISDLRQLCNAIEVKIDGKYRETASMLARMDLVRRTGILQVMEDNIAAYKTRLRQVLTDLRRVRSSATPSVTDATGGSSHSTHDIRGYKRTWSD